MNKTVYIVHSIDTEGPLNEDLNATFIRLKDSFGINLSPSYKTLIKLQNKSIKLNGLENAVSKFVSANLLKYNKNWTDVDKMLDKLLTKNFRNKLLDSFGNGWIYNWHCMDHVGFIENPRKRDLGFHKIFDHYKKKLEESLSYKDAIHFHHHPIPFLKQAHIPATHFFSHTPVIYEIIARKIIDRKWFPSVYRPGFHSTRPDSHWFLEQFIPFDIANQKNKDNYSQFKDIGNGRFGDWRRAPMSWEPYHPSHDDYQKKGNCRRWICKSLNLGTRHKLLKIDDIRQAFKEAAMGKPVLLSFNDHDFRDIGPDVIKFQGMIRKVSKEFPDIKYKFCEARNGIREALKLRKKTHINFKFKIDTNILHISTTKPTFGPQPFLAIKTKKGKYFHDNFDFQKSFYEWTYTFDDSTQTIDQIESIGVGTCDSFGNVTVLNINPKTMQSTQTKI